MWARVKKGYRDESSAGHMLFFVSLSCIDLLYFFGASLFFSEPCEPSHPMQRCVIQLGKRPKGISAVVPNDMRDGGNSF